MHCQKHAQIAQTLGRLGVGVINAHELTLRVMRHLARDEELVPNAPRVPVPWGGRKTRDELGFVHWRLGFAGRATERKELGM